MNHIVIAYNQLVTIFDVVIWSCNKFTGHW